MSEYAAEGKTPEVLFWVGCAGSYDARAQKITVAFTKILNEANVNFAVLGKEESCTGDPARRAGNEFVFQMMALQNIEVLNMYNVKKIVTTCPHCFNIIKNEYPELGGKYEVMHHTQLLQSLIDEGRIKLTDSTEFKGKTITYHDSCYMGRGNGVYEAPRAVLAALDGNLVEMPRHGKNGLCCGAGGAQMFKEDELGDRSVNVERSAEAINTRAEIVVANCPFCMVMLNDGMKAHDKEDEVMVYDLAEMIVDNMVDG